MKKVMFALLAFLLSASVVSITSASVLTDYGITTQDDKVKIKPEELPDAVKTALNSPDYTGWQISAAFKYNETEVYEIELKNGDETMTVRFDKDGKKVE